MTCIVGLVEKGKVYLGGDSAGLTGWDLVVRKDPKVFRVGKFIIGCTSSFRMIQLLMYSFKPPKIKKGQDIHEYMCTDFIEAMRKCFKDGGYMEISKEVETSGHFLVGYKSRLFNVDVDLQVGEPQDGLASVGCGAPFALGALSILKHDMDLLPENKVREALKIAEYRSGGVQGPFVLLST